MIICICSNISDKEIKKKIIEKKSFEEIQYELGVCCNCRICKKDIEELINNEQKNERNH